MKNKIIKITLLVSFFVSGITIAQEFYTCVPKRDWWIEMVRQGNKKWKNIIYLTLASKKEEFK